MEKGVSNVFFSRKRVYIDKIVKMAGCIDCFCSCIYHCCLCLRLMDRIKFIDPKNVELGISEEEEEDPDYIPVYLDMSGAQHKCANMAP